MIRRPLPKFSKWHEIARELFFAKRVGMDGGDCEIAASEEQTPPASQDDINYAHGCAAGEISGLPRDGQDVNSEDADESLRNANSSELVEYK
jgi:hypothetical protein